MSTTAPPAPAAEDAQLLRQLLPPGVQAAQVRIGGRLHWPGQAAEEAAHCAQAVVRRRAEFGAGRWCARTALWALAAARDGRDAAADLDAQDLSEASGAPTAGDGPDLRHADQQAAQVGGQAVGPEVDLAALWRRTHWLPVAADRQPLWPEGCRGSISHDAELAMAVVADARDCAALGLDVEQQGRLDDPSLLPMYMDGQERRAHDALRTPEARALRRLQTWCAKEAVFKALYPRTGRWLDPLELAVRDWPTHSGGRFSAEIDTGTRTRTPIRTDEWPQPGGARAAQDLAARAVPGPVLRVHGRLAWNARRCVALVHWRRLPWD